MTCEKSFKEEAVRLSDETGVKKACDDKGLPKTKNVLAKTKAECQEKLKQLKAECDITKPDDVAPDGEFLLAAYHILTFIL